MCPLFWSMTDEEKVAYKVGIEEELVKRAVEQKVVTSRDDAVVRDLLPSTDFGDTNEVWTQSLTANTYVSTYTPTPDSKKVIAIYGVKNANATPITTVIKFGLGAGPAKVKDLWGVEPAWLELNTEALTSEPIIYNKEERVTIQQYSSATATDNVLFLGLICEPKGENVMQ